MSKIYKFRLAEVALRYSKPVIDSLALDGETGLEQVIANFGEPRETDIDSEETILYYDLSKLTVEYEFSDVDKLKRVNVYPT